MTVEKFKFILTVILTENKIQIHPWYFSASPPIFNVYKGMHCFLTIKFHFFLICFPLPTTLTDSLSLSLYLLRLG
jgi:hypothetical protein